MENKLLPYQIDHVHNLVSIINTRHRAIDISDTGTGKTYTSVAICKILNLIPFIICPKSVVSSWKEILESFEYLESNYELTTYNQILKKEINFENSYLFIFDEVHKCKNKDTLNAKILMEIADESTKILMLSATAVDKIGSFIVYGYVLRLYKTLEEGNLWINNIGANNIIKVHKILFPKYASRMCIDDTEDIFKNNNIEMEGIDMENYYRIEEQYDELDKLLKKKNNLGNIQKLRQKIEYLKIDTFVEITNNYILDNKSVVIFVNFTETLLELSKQLNTKCIIYGKQTIEERAVNIKNFSMDKSRIIICNIQSGGCGISLHDTNGKYQRISLISPTWSGQDLLQVLGRIHRATAKTDSIQRIIFCKNTIEENVGKILQSKINNIKTLNNGNNLKKNDSIKNIIQLQTKIKTNNKQKEIEQIEDYEVIYNILTNLYTTKEINETQLLDSSFTQNQKNEINYKLKKILNEINIFETKLNNGLNT